MREERQVKTRGEGRQETTDGKKGRRIREGRETREYRWKRGRRIQDGRGAGKDKR